MLSLETTVSLLSFLERFEKSNVSLFSFLSIFVSLNSNFLKSLVFTLLIFIILFTVSFISNIMDLLPSILSAGILSIKEAISSFSFREEISIILFILSSIFLNIFSASHWVNLPTMMNLLNLVLQTKNT